MGMQATDIRRYPTAKLLALGLGATSQRVTTFMKAHGRRPATDSSDPDEANLAKELARAEALSLRTSQAKRNARQLVTTMFTSNTPNASTR
jgi:hypothetical protein